MFDNYINVDPFDWVDSQEKLYKQQWLQNHDDEAINLFEIGQSYDDEEQLEKYNPAKAIKYYQMAADLEYAPALDSLGCYFESNEYEEWGIKENIEEAKSLYLQAIELGYLLSYSSIAQIYFYEKDYQQASYYFKFCADANCPHSQHMMGLCSEQLGKPQEAEIWYIKSISGGLFSGWNNLGSLYYYGAGNGTIKPQSDFFPKDYSTALTCYKLAYKYLDGSNNPEMKASVLMSIADCYFHGKGTDENKKLAIEMYIEASNVDSWACNELGGIYMLGNGTNQNPDLALEYFEKGAEMGNDWCMYELGCFYRWGEYDKYNMEYSNEKYIDYKKALYWYERGAELGDEECIRAVTQYKNGEWE